MTTIELTPETLTVRLSGWDRVWALRSRVEVPLAHVRAVEIDPSAARGWWKGARLPGTHLPGVIIAGTFLRGGERTFYSVRDPAKAVVIHLADERYTRLVVQVADPPATVAAIRRAVAAARPARAA